MTVEMRRLKKSKAANSLEEAVRVAEALSGFTSCAFCGAEFRKDTDAGKIKEHIRCCPKHPFADLSDEVAKLKNTIDEYDKERTEIRNLLMEAKIPEHYDDDGSFRMYSLVTRVRFLRQQAEIRADILFENRLQDDIKKVRFEKTPERDAGDKEARSLQD